MTTSSWNNRFSTVIIAALFFLYAGGLILITGKVDGSIIAKLTWSSIYAAALLVAFYSARSLLHTMRRNLGFITLGTLCLISTAWSSNPGVTISYGIALFGSTLVAYQVATKIEPIRLFQIIAIAIFIILTVNFVLILPNLGRNLSPNFRYTGIFPHPNMLGRVAGLGVLLFLILLYSGIFSRFWGSIGVVIGVVLITSCDSMTSAVGTLMALGLFFLRKFIGRPVGTGQIAIVAWFMLCIGGIIWLNLGVIIGYIFELLGRSPTLTGRTELWAGIRGAILHKPILGYGYSGFWSGERLLSEKILLEAGWTTASAHNGLYDIALHLGFVGVFIFVVAIGRSLFDGLKYTFGTSSQAAVILLSVLCYLIILGMTESAYMMRNSINWVLLVLCSIYIRQLHDEGALQRK